MASDDSLLPGTAGILDNVVGGLELSISFSHHEDRERVLEVARGLGWAEDEDECCDPAEDQGQMDDLVNLSVTVPKVWLPLRCLLLAGHKHLHKSTYCYLRYRLYDKEVVCSPLKRPALSGDGQRATIVFEQTRTVELMKHQPLMWYLREEKLEIQIWRSYGKDTSGPRPQDTDRLLGCAYVDLAGLSENTSRTLSVSGVYPLFKHNVPNLWGAAVRVHLCLSSAYHPSPSAREQTALEKEESLSEDPEELDVSEDSPDGKPDDRSQSNRKEQTDKPSGSPDRESAAVELENTIPVNIVVERAMHLSLKGSPLTERAVPVPSCCVSFPVAGTTTPVSTPVVDSTDSPVWDFQQQVRLSRDLLLDPQQTLVFKVWHKADVERVLGFAAVDLSPLLSGFQSVCGWYNIGDFTGQCQGQIKVSVTPLENISHLRVEKRLWKEASPRQPEVTSLPSSLYHSSPTLFGSFPAFLLPHTMADVTNVQREANRRENIIPSVQHDDDTQTRRCFREPVQQVEQNTWSAEHTDAPPQDSRTSLLPALRKNLTELDDIQKYFNQKLYRSLSSKEPAEGASLQAVESKLPSSEDIDTHLLLTKSNLLVSQVSNLISGLQDNRLFQGPPTSRRSDATSSVQEVSPARAAECELVPCHQADDGSDHHRADTPLLSTAGSPPPREDNMEDEADLPLGKDNFFLAHDFHASSEEEYEENVIEPRTLNEITTLTDRTSPWSSMLSEPEYIGTDGTSPADPSEDCPLLSQGLYKVDQSVDFSSDEFQSPSEDLRVPSRAEGDTEAQELEPARDLQAFSTDRTTNHREDEGSDQRRGEEPITSAELGTDDTLVPDEESEDQGAEEERRSQSDSTHPCTSEEEVTDPSALRGKPGAHLLSDPVRLPNFFLPPKDLEASMRVLSLSPPVPSEPKDEDPGVSTGIPPRRSRRAHRVASGELPQAEVDRIARIFAAQFSSKK